MNKNQSVKKKVLWARNRNLIKIKAFIKWQIKLEILKNIKNNNNSINLLIGKTTKLRKYKKINRNMRW